ncbi:MAG TPA: ABC transporter substrate-binding protein [Solirubrobacteraceae bacterium]|nr:ABC transporter substrate-binding protein [Solirubrobacteraceae bacterium]
MRRHLAALAAVAATLGLSACGGASHRSASRTAPARGRPQPVSLVLDFTPNAVHVGIYAALAQRLDIRNGIRLHVEVPGASTDAISELEAGRVDFAILDIHDLALADRSDPRHPPIVGILPIVERPLAAVIAAPGITSPRQLAGHTVGVPGDPSDFAVLRSVVAGSGGDPARVHTVDIGYNAVADLLSGRVKAATAFWNDEGVTLERRGGGRRFHIFRVDDYGAPSYPELVVCATRAGLRADPARARALVRTLSAGYDAAIAHPARAARELERQVSGLDPGLVSAELPGLVAAFTGPEHRFGIFDMQLLARWARWEARFGIVKRPPDVHAMFSPALASGG